MQCPFCDADNGTGRRFCSGCGAPLPVGCPSCGFLNRPTDRFCGGCGSRLAADAPSPQPDAAPWAAPGIDEERKHVTVLFADVKGSMELLADRDPEEARRILDPVLELMIEAVRRYEGTVNQVMGDGIMALFGAPTGHEDHAIRACYAALRMQDMARRYADATRRTQGINVQMRLGLNSGEVVVRAIGNDRHMDYTAVGQTTHLAARMEQLAIPGTILLTAATVKLAEGHVDVKPLGPVPVRGLATPVEVYELTGAGPVRRRFEAATARGLTRFVGRDAELHQLRAALDVAATGHGQVVAVAGEPGIGKSRLFHEFTHSRHTRGWLTLESGSASYGKATAYLPVMDLLRAYFAVDDQDDHRKIREKVTGKLVILDERLVPSMPVFLALLNVPADDSRWRDLDPPQRRQRTLEAIKQLLLRESQAQPVCLVFEDLHWIDSETQTVLDNLVEGLAESRILLLVNYRPEYEDRWSASPCYRQLQLDALPPQNAHEVLEALVGNHPSLAALKRLLIDRTEGNPFFLEESVRTLVEMKALAGERGAYWLTRPVDAIQVPATVQALLAARIDRLPPKEKRLLQSAAVIGHEVPLALLQAVVDEDRQDIREGLANLQSAEFLYETSLYPDVEYTFKHSLTHEVASKSLLNVRRRDLHARIVTAIEQLRAERVGEHVDELAYHALNAEMWDKAVGFLRQAGRRAASRSASREAVGFFEQALGALGHLPESPALIAEGIDTRLELQSALIPVDEIDRMLVYLREAEGLARKIDDRRRLGQVWAHMTYCFAWLGQSEAAVDYGRRALDVGAALGDSTLEALTNFHLGRALFVGGEYRKAIGFLTRTAETLQGSRLHERFGMPAIPAATSRVLAGLCMAYLGDFPGAGVSAEDGLAVAEAAEHPFTLAVARWGVGLTHLLQGNVREAIFWLERSTQLCRANHFDNIFALAGAPLGYAYALSGRPAEGIALLEQTTGLADAVNRASHAVNLGRLAEAYLMTDRLPEALETVERALTLARTQNLPGGEAAALRILGEICVAMKPPDVSRAESAYRDALERAERLEIRPLLARCHLDLGRLYRQTGKHQIAREHLAAAVMLYRDMHMRAGLEAAERESARSA
jgi:class 3 adenylate cyclase/tetratricopeptide (TPR) repeat protein